MIKSFCSIKFPDIQILLPSVFLFLFSACIQTTATTELILAHGLDQSHSVHKAMVFMADRVKEKSEGQMEIKIYPSGQLGAERECLELLQIGSLAITKVSSAVLEGFVPEYQVLGLPFIFRDKEHLWKVLNGDIGLELLQKGEDMNLRGLCFYDAGSRSFYTKEFPVLHPDDLKGLKIRVLKSNTAVEMVKALGGAPTPISWGELYTALQGGVVDGAENNPPSFYLSHHYEVCKYYSLDEHSSVPDVLLIGSAIWQKLSTQEKLWLSEAAMESVTYQRDLWKKAEEKALAEVIKAGVTVVYPDKQAFKDQVKEMIDGLNTDTIIYSLVERIRDQK